MSKQAAKERRMCTGKVRHGSAYAAGLAAERVFQETGHWVRPYYCRACGGFHCGSTRALSQR